MTDPLTGLANARSFDPVLERELAIARREGQPVAVIMLDLDDFKGFNDRYGHQAGDDLLRRAARAWRSAIRVNDVLARYGGEEFAVLLAGCEVDVAMDIAERLRQATIDEVRVSIGVARWDGSETAEKLIARADSALYDAKRAGRNQVHGDRVTQT